MTSAQSITHTLALGYSLDLEYPSKTHVLDVLSPGWCCWEVLETLRSGAWKEVFWVVVGIHSKEIVGLQPLLLPLFHFLAMEWAGLLHICSHHDVPPQGESNRAK